MRPKYEVADVLRTHWPQVLGMPGINGWQLRTLGAIMRCRTAALGGHKDVCTDCGTMQVSYNSCWNRHCPPEASGSAAQTRGMNCRTSTGITSCAVFSCGFYTALRAQQTGHAQAMSKIFRARYLEQFRKRCKPEQSLLNAVYK